MHEGFSFHMVENSVPRNTTAHGCVTQHPSRLQNSSPTKPSTPKLASWFLLIQGSHTPDSLCTYNTFCLECPCPRYLLNGFFSSFPKLRSQWHLCKKTLSRITFSWYIVLIYFSPQHLKLLVCSLFLTFSFYLLLYPLSDNGPRQPGNAACVGHWSNLSNNAEQTVNELLSKGAWGTCCVTLITEGNLSSGQSEING